MLFWFADACGLMSHRASPYRLLNTELAMLAHTLAKKTVPSIARYGAMGARHALYGLRFFR